MIKRISQKSSGVLTSRGKQTSCSDHLIVNGLDSEMMIVARVVRRKGHIQKKTRAHNDYNHGP